VFRYAKVETVSDPYAFLHKTAIKLAKDHRRRRSAWFREPSQNRRTGERQDPKDR
jgi:DNA-directed RNA polymerase specialized sigma24 family protein